MRWARAAPRTIPIASEPRMPIPATFSVCFSPPQKSGMCSQMKCQSKLARTVIERRGGGRPPLRPPPAASSRTDRRYRLADRILKGVLRPGDVVDEVRHESCGRVVAQELHELIPLLHVTEP